MRLTTLNLDQVILVPYTEAVEINKRNLVWFNENFSTVV